MVIGLIILAIVYNTELEKSKKSPFNLIPTQSPLAISSISNLPVTPSSVPLVTSEIDSSEWKIYRNEKYRFEVKYPQEAVWSFKEGDTSSPMSSLVNGRSEINFLVVSLNNWEGVKSLGSFYHQIIEPSIKNKTSGYSTLDISGYKAIKYIDNSQYVTVAILRDNYLYRFWYSDGDNMSAVFFNQVLSSFKFLN